MVYIGIQKEIFIFNRESCLGEFNGNILIIEPHFLHFRRRIAMFSVNDSVSGEAAIVRAIVEISSITEKFIPIPVFCYNGLIDIIPDKSALVKRFRLGQVGIFMHSAAGISHRMCIFAVNVRLIPILSEPLFDILHCPVHCAFHIGCIGEPSVP